MTDKNANQVWISIFVNQLAAFGIEHVVIGAGSRSTPLTLAFTRNSAFQCYSQVDERSAGFFALGIAKSTETPTVLVCTSGTAAANFFPAIIEAQASSVPLIVCTADRPPELRISGANQTTDQIKLFGDHVRWFVDVALPELPVTSRMRRYLQSLAMQSVEKSQYPNAGPVHLNFPFRKPLQPHANKHSSPLPESISETALVPRRVLLGQSSPSKDQILKFEELVNTSSRVMIICGPNASRYLSIKQLQQFVQETGALLVTDALSGYRYHKNDEKQITSYETFLQWHDELDLPVPDLILHFGDMPISKYLSQWLEKIETSWVLINPRVANSDGIHGSTIWFRCNPEVLVSSTNISNTEDKEFTRQWIELDQKIRYEMGLLESEHSYFEPMIINKVVQQLPASSLFLANSLTVRHFDQFIHTSDADLDIYSNRGVSGIDGTLSTALGIAVTSSNPVVLVTGDLAFYHDLNGLLAMMRYQISLKIIIINNQGGVIFDRLPIRDFEPPFNEYFLTRHQLKFDLIAKQFNVEHIMVRDQEELEGSIDQFIQSDQIILEIQVQPDDMEKTRQKLIQEIQKRIT